MEELKYSCAGKSLNKTGDDGRPLREECGADLTNLIAALTSDGKMHELKCPACGNVSTVRKTV